MTEDKNLHVVAENRVSQRAGRDPKMGRRASSI